MRKKISINELEVGKVYNSPIYIDEKNVLIPAHTVIKQEDIERLKRWKIKEVEMDEGVVDKNNAEKKESSIEERKRKLAEMSKKLAPEIKIVEKKLEQEDKNGSSKHLTVYNIYVDILNDVRQILFDIRLDKIVQKNLVNKAVDKIFDVVLNQKYDILNVVSRYKGAEQNYLVIHSLNVAIYSACIGFGLDLNHFKIKHLITGAMLHDVGMLKIDERVINKKEKLTSAEYDIVKNHTLIGYKLLNQKEGFPSEVAQVALQHHERYNGTGYPSGNSGENIPLFARIVAIADSYDAMTQIRTYKVKTISHEAIKNVMAASKNLYDPHILKVFLSIMSIYPIGSIVQLNNGIIGIVSRANPKFPLRPVIRILLDEFGDKILEIEEIDLEETPNLFITSTLNSEDLDFQLEEFL